MSELQTFFETLSFGLFFVWIFSGSEYVPTYVFIAIGLLWVACIAAWNKLATMNQTPQTPPTHSSSSDS